MKNNKTALVCGGSDGIGFGVAAELAKSDISVIILGRSANKLRSKLEELHSISAMQHNAITADFNDLEDVNSKVSKILKNQSIDILINNSGGPNPGKLEDATLDQLKNAFQTHVLASHLLAQIVTPGMKANGFGRIINITSTSIRQPINGLGVSNTIRGAMASWSKTLSTELAPHGITVNNILPGTTKTGRLDQIISAKEQKLNLSTSQVVDDLLSEIPVGRFAEVAEIAKAIAFLASSDASYITGVNLQVDGGKIKSI